MTKNSSIDQKELNKFNKTSKEWWDKSGEFKILHKINPLRLKYIGDKLIEHFDIHKISTKNTNPLANLDIIDIGCGGGLVTIPICELGANVTAIDANKHNIEASSEQAKKLNLKINFVNSTVEEYINISPKNLYDVVLCLEVVEHVANQEEFIQNLLKLIKPNGILILSTINRTMKSYAQAIIIAEYTLKWVPINTHNHSKFLQPSELHNIIKQKDFYLKDLTGLQFNPLTNNWYLSDNIDVNYFACIANCID
jgi:2-polyprenyl-6-hydroxyphenyl methylase/3-demethylubiquinone-9 3-methyltransferase